MPKFFFILNYNHIGMRCLKTQQKTCILYLFVANLLTKEAAKIYKKARGIFCIFQIKPDLQCADYHTQSNYLPGCLSVYLPL